MKRLFRALPFILCLCLVLTALSVSASAAEYLDPSDYLVDVTADGNTKIVHYEFDDRPWLITTWNNLTQAYIDYTGQVDYGVPTGAKQVLFKTYPFGGPVYGDTLPWNGVAFDVSDILPGSPIDFDLPFHFRMTWADNGAFGVTLTYRYGVAYYNSDGSYAGTIDGTDHTMSFISATGSRHEWEASLSVAGTIPAKAHYIVPYIELDTVFDIAVIGATVSFGGGDCDLYIDVNTVIENSNMMQSINNKLDDIGNKLDDISGALNGDANVDAGVSDFSGANDTLSNAMQSAGVVMDAGSDSVSDIANSSVMAGTLASLGSGLSVAFSDEFQVNLCGMSFNPFTLWVTVIGGFSLIALMVAYIFRKRGGS